MRLGVERAFYIPVSFVVNELHLYPYSSIYKGREGG